mgnify:FL=1
MDAPRTNDRPAVADRVFAACLQAEHTGQATVSLTGIRLEDNFTPLRTGTQDVYTYTLADILLALRNARGYTADVTTFAGSLTKTHGKDAQMVVPKRMHTSVESMYRGFGRKGMNAILRDVHGGDWWKGADKQLRQESLMIRVIANDGIVPVIAPKEKVVASAPAPTAAVNEFLAQHNIAAPEPAPAPAPAVKQSITDILASLQATGTATIDSNVLTVESTKVELVAAVVASTGMDEAQASLLNKTTLASLI